MNTAEQFGTGLLKSIQQESLTSLLSTLRTVLNRPTTNITGLLELDSILFPTTDNTASVHVQPGLAISALDDAYNAPHPFPVRANHHNDFDEEDGGHADDASLKRRWTAASKSPIIINLPQTQASSSAATHALIADLVAVQLLPPRYAARDKAVVYLDCSNTLDIGYVYSTIVDHIAATKRDNEADEQEVQETARNALRYLHILHPTSTLSLLDTLRELPAYLLDRTAHESTHKALGLLVVHGIDTWKFQDKLNLALVRLEGANDQPHAATSSTRPASRNATTNTISELPTQIINELKALQQRFECFAAYTTSPTGISRDVYAREATISVEVRRSDIDHTVPKFAPQVDLQGCLRDRERRLKSLYKSSAAPAGEEDNVRRSAIYSLRQVR